MHKSGSATAPGKDHGQTQGGKTPQTPVTLDDKRLPGFETVPGAGSSPTSGVDTKGPQKG